MFMSPRIKTSWASKLVEFEILFDKSSRKFEAEGGRYTTPNNIGVVLGRRISINIFSKSWGKSVCWLILFIYHFIYYR